MKINICNYTPQSITALLNVLLSNLPKDISPTPISIDIEFAKIEVNNATNIMSVTPYDYYDNAGKSAEMEIDDANLLFDEVSCEDEVLIVNGETYQLLPCSTTKRNNTPR